MCTLHRRSTSVRTYTVSGTTVSNSVSVSLQKARLYPASPMPRSKATRPRSQAMLVCADAYRRACRGEGVANEHDTWLPVALGDVKIDGP